MSDVSFTLHSGFSRTYRKIPWSLGIHEVLPGRLSNFRAIRQFRYSVSDAEMPKIWLHFLEFEALWNDLRITESGSVVYVFSREIHQHKPNVNFALTKSEVRIITPPWSNTHYHHPSPPHPKHKRRHVDLIQLIRMHEKLGMASQTAIWHYEILSSIRSSL